MGITSWTGLCRLNRAEVLKLREIEYVQAADAFGVSRGRIMLQHLVPNVMHIVLISTVLRFRGLVLAEAVLAYVGIGVDPSMQSWGNMINQARLELARDPVVWWNLLAAFVHVGLVLPARSLGDAVQDALIRVSDMMSHALRVRDLKTVRIKNGPARAVDGVSFDINEGETLALVGESGSNRVTALSIMQLLPQPAGMPESIELQGQDLLRRRNFCAAMRWP
jgi:hypothetical protein